MKKNTLIAVIAICFTLNILAGGYIYYDMHKNKVAANPTQNSSLTLASLPSDVTDIAVAEPAPESATVAEEENDATVYKAKPVVVRKTKRQDIVNHLDKYLNFIPYSNPKPKDGFDDISFTLVNKSNFTFDQVVVDFSCYLANGSLWTQRTFTVGPIPPNGSFDQTVPDQLRGSRIEWKTVGITSSELDFAWKK